MKGWIVRWILNGIALLLTASLISGIELSGFCRFVCCLYSWNCKRYYKASDTLINFTY